jgi:hypothetical protein
LNVNEIREAIENARNGIRRYVEIMELFPITDVSRDKYFQRKFNGFYRIKQRPATWYEVYYGYMESQKGKYPTFSQVLRHLYSVLNRYEPSFSSKLVATIHPDTPIWDSIVLKLVGIRPPLFTSRAKVVQAEVAYQKLQAWHKKHMSSDHGRLILSVFEEMVPEHEKISDLKKIDFVLWQSRSEQAIPME